MGIPAPLGVGACGLPPKGDQANAVVSGSFGAIGPGKPFCFQGPMNVAFWASSTTALTTTNGSDAATVVDGTGIGPGSSINSVNVPRGTTWKTFVGTAGTLALPTVTFSASGLSTSSADITLPAGSNVASLVGATVTVPSNVEGLTIPANTTVLAVVQADTAPSVNSTGQPGIVTLSAAPTLVPAIDSTVRPQPLEFALTNTAVTTGVDNAASFTGAAIEFVGSVQLERSFDGGATWIIATVGDDGTLAVYSAGTPVNLTFGEPEKGVLYRLNCTLHTSGAISYRISATGQAATSLSVPTI